MSPDPKGQYASPYLGMGNNPVNLIDKDGGYAGGPCDNGASDCYKIESGETLSGISTYLGISQERLLELNPSITNPNEIFAGQEINLGGDYWINTPQGNILLVASGQPQSGDLSKFERYSPPPNFKDLGTPVEFDGAVMVELFMEYFPWAAGAGSGALLTKSGNSMYRTFGYAVNYSDDIVKTGRSFSNITYDSGVFLKAGKKHNFPTMLDDIIIENGAWAQRLDDGANWFEAHGTMTLRGKNVEGVYQIGITDKGKIFHRNFVELNVYIKNARR